MEEIKVKLSDVKRFVVKPFDISQSNLTIPRFTSIGSPSRRFGRSIVPSNNAFGSPRITSPRPIVKSSFRPNSFKMNKSVVPLNTMVVRDQATQRAEIGRLARRTVLSVDISARDDYLQQVESAYSQNAQAADARYHLSVHSDELKALIF